jgi:hypothetical protein
MKFFSLIIKQLHKSLRNIHIYFDTPLAFEPEMNLLYIIKQQQTNKQAHGNFRIHFKSFIILSKKFLWQSAYIQNLILQKAHGNNRFMLGIFEDFNVG